MPDLIIVESPTKAKEVAHIMGSRFVVKASMGHIRDLPAKELGVDPKSLRPSYEIKDRSKGLVGNLKKLARESQTVYLATDLDREGEAIAAHLFDVLKLKKENTKRVVYNKLTESAVKEAFRNARGIDYDLVAAQEARRVLDRLVGYTVSPALWESGVTGLSAGRVQSVVVRMVVERDREIAKHSKRKHFGAALFVDTTEPQFSVEWVTKKYADDDGLVLDRELAEKAASVRDLLVTKHEVQTKTKNPPPPFTTSTLQQAGNTQLDLTSSRVMQVAQKLFEAGRITYMRTDSVNISDEGLEDIRNFAHSKALPLPSSPILHEGKRANAQEAHECVRPTDMFYSGEDLPSDERAVYQLIHQQTLACQLAPAQIEETHLLLKGEHSNDDLVFDYSARAVTIVKPGFMHVMGKVEESWLPHFEEGDQVTADRSKVLEKETKPPSHFSEASLTKQLEKKGIGRPSTYAAIIENIKHKKYITVSGKKLLATELGDKLIQVLRPDEENGCKFMEYQYTAELEEELDKIARGEAKFYPVVSNANQYVQADTEQVAERIKSVSLSNANTSAIAGPSPGGKRSSRRKSATVVKSAGKASSTLGSKSCPKCSKPLAVRKGKNGPFLGCTGYPDCRHTENTMANAAQKKSQPTGKQPGAEDKVCAKCGSAMKLRPGKYGDFFGCTAYPGCKHTEKAG